MEKKTRKLGETTLSAEELGMILEERIRYDELELKDTNGNSILIDKTSLQIEEITVKQGTDSRETPQNF